MKFYFAPMEGITGYIFRNAYERHYGGIDKYFAPFISPNGECSMLEKDKRDMLAEHNEGLQVIPQILTNNAEHFIRTAVELREMGYEEINLNLGCPSGTVCAKGKGSGFLTRLDDLDAFLEKIYDCQQLQGVKISVKTRLGKFEAEEFEEILDLYNWYPISELIVHPRVQKEFYKGEVHMDMYEYTLEHSKNPVIYNGDINTVENIRKMESKGETTLMLGRGLLMNPELLEEYKEIAIEDEALDRINVSKTWQKGLQKERFRAFHDEIYRGYQEIMSPDKTVLYRMKELWTYWKELFPEEERLVKKILKSKYCVEYDGYVRELMIMD